MKLDWKKLFEDMAGTPIEAIQPHYMRIACAGGTLGKTYAEGWKPEDAGLLQAVLKENHRWLTHHAQDVLSDMALTQGPEGPAVSENVSRTTGGSGMRA